MFSLVITNIWQKVNDVALAPYSTIFLIFVVIFRQDIFSSILRYLCWFFFSFMSHMTYYYYHLSSVMFCDFQNIFNESRSQKSMLIFDDKTLTYLWRIKILSIHYFVVFYLGHCVLLPPNTFKLFRHPVFLFWVYLMKVIPVTCRAQ
jgi:hypothetical protein